MYCVGPNIDLRILDCNVLYAHYVNVGLLRYFLLVFYSSPVLVETSSYRSNVGSYSLYFQEFYSGIEVMKTGCIKCSLYQYCEFLESYWGLH